MWSFVAAMAFALGRVAYVRILAHAVDFMSALGPILRRVIDMTGSVRRTFWWIILESQKQNSIIFSYNVLLI